MANYLYNGVELPQLPEWDKTTYPYAVISQTSSGTAYLYCSHDPFAYNSLLKMVVNNPGSTDYLKFVVTDGTFVSTEKDDAELCAASSSTRPAVWTNRDIYGMSDTTALYLAASDPVPVLTRSPAAMALGWLAGMAVRRMRDGARWETLWEGEVTTAADDSAYGINASLTEFDFYNNPDWIYRVTVGNETITEVPRYIPEDDNSIGSYYSAYILGNRNLMSAEHEDSGCGFCITELEDEIFIVPAVLTTREAGTYSVKIEKLLREPVAYLCNGVRYPSLPAVDGYNYAYITASATGVARLVLSTEDLGFSVTESAFYTIWGEEASLIIYLCDNNQWIQNGEVTIAEGETYTVNGETLAWAENDALDPETYDTILDGSKPVPIFDYKEW